MRRTYKSKKEAGGLDLRDVKQSVDAKCSVFDAFYIENIKQAKRELSCLRVSNQFSASNRVRKKKYVKRLKEPELFREFTSGSTYLTPDKSLRVNKHEDLFDKLLRSSPPQNSPIHKSVSKNTNKKVTRVYNKRRRNIKKKNCSSTDSSGSSKENDTFDQSDIKSHKLQIEKDKNNSWKRFNDSIEKIDTDLSMLGHKERDCLSLTPNKEISQIRSIEVGKSPLCSTPFHEKYRGKSIYKISPISIYSHHKLINLTENRISEVNDKPITNKISTSATQIDADEDELSLENTNEEQHIPCITITDDFSFNYHGHVSKQDVSLESLVAGSQIEDCDLEQTNNSLLNPQEQDSSIFLQTPEPLKCLGFSNINKTADIEILNKYKELNNQLCLSMTYTDDELPSEPFLGFINDNPSYLREEVESNSSSSLNDLDNSENMQSRSLYDTCSENESKETISLASKQPIVIIERLSKSILENYLNTHTSKTESDLNKSSSNNSSDVYTSFDTDKSNISSEINEDIEIDGFSDESLLNNCSSSDNNRDDEDVNFVTTRRRNEISNDSFFFIKDNLISSINSSDIDNTIISRSDSEETCVETTLVEKKEQEILDIAVTISNNNEDETAKTSSYIVEDVVDAKRIKQSQHSPRSSITLRRSHRPVANRPSVTTRNSARVSRDTLLNTSEIRNPIVLQPGKKWERSLSIYRRMTTMVDGTDFSILDIEPLENKGRKYRQSVIATIEMQDLNASLNNETIKSRRSSFVSQPIRSTIKLDSNASRTSICSSAVYDDLKGFLTEDCDDTVIDLSKLSLGDSEVEVTILENFHDTPSRSSTARDYVLRRCNQTDALLFDECYPDTTLKNCRKIGEGVYGEVFLWRAGDGRARVLKVIPVAGDVLVNGERQKDYAQIISEIVIAMELSALGAPIPDIESHFNEGKSVETLDLHSVENATDVFNKVLAVRLVYGSYPSRLLDLWELYDECKGSENDNPASLPPHQHFIVLELANAGQDLESYQFHNAEQAYALFKQVAFGLAVAEEALQFEHRDLHWGNVLIAPTDLKYATFVLRGREHRVPTGGVRATVIDYSLSRAACPASAPLYADLADDDALFDAVGDYQFHVYRLMRERLGNDWKNYDPYTNVLWLHYTADKMITALRYTRTNTKIHKLYIAKLKDIQNRILHYGSAAEYVITDNEI